MTSKDGREQQAGCRNRTTHNVPHRYDRDVQSGCLVACDTL